jgi:quercetin dioxygenase-like cupin family protein
MPRKFDHFPLDQGFHILNDNGRTQIATTVIEPGGKVGNHENKHPYSDQCAYILDGQGEAWIAGNKISLEKGSLVLIEASEKHELHNTGESPLRILNIYAPPEQWDKK